MTRTLPFLILLALGANACRKTEDCPLHAPALVWQTQLSDLSDVVLPPFVYGQNIWFASGLDNTQLITLRATDGATTFQPGWSQPKAVGQYLREGPYLYWLDGSRILRRHLELNTVELLGSAQNCFNYFNEGSATPFEGLVAGYYHKSAMTDRDNAIIVFDMATQAELYRYQVDDAQLTTNLGDPALGRTAQGDTILAFMENTRHLLLIQNLSTHDSIEVPLPNDELFVPFLRNIYIRDGRIYLGLHKTLYCFDGATGAQLWKREEGESSKICLVRFWDDKLLFHTNAENLYALDPATGQTIWARKAVGFVPLLQVRSGDIIYFTAHDSEHNRNHLLGIDLNQGCTRVYVDALFSEYSGIIGATPDGYLLFQSADSFAAYR